MKKVLDRRKINKPSVHQLEMVAKFRNNTKKVFVFEKQNISKIAFKKIIFHSILGGRGTWHKYLTLPNILKNFNPNLKGKVIVNVKF